MSDAKHQALIAVIVLAAVVMLYVGSYVVLRLMHVMVRTDHFYNADHILVERAEWMRAGGSETSILVTIYRPLWEWEYRLRR